MIYRDHKIGIQMLECDECGEFQDEDFYDDHFQRMIDSAKSAGWSISRDGSGVWRHLCPDCKPSGLAAQRALLGL